MNKSYIDTSIPQRQIEIKQLWADEEAYTLFNESFDLASGSIINIDSFSKLWQQANLGDKNAFFYQLRIKMVTDSFYTSYEKGMWEHEERILDFYQPETSIMTIINPTGYISNKDNYYKVIVNLANAGHPLSSDFLIKYGMDSREWAEMLGDSDESQQESLIRYHENAIKGGYHYHDSWAELSFFSLDKIWQEPLVKHDRKVTLEHQIDLIEKGYKVAALNGSLNSAFRVVEAYYYGVGVSKDYEQAYIWSRVIDMAYSVLLDNTAKDSNEADIDDYKHSLKEVFRRNRELQPQIELHLNMNQRISSQKAVDDLLGQIDFHYIEWIKQRDPVPPMP